MTLKVAVYGSRRQEPFANQISSLLTELSQRGCSIILHQKLANHLSEIFGGFNGWNVTAVVSSADFSADIALSIGGDGTFLRTARWVAEKNIPILGINTGHLGFLTAFDIAECHTIVETLFSGKFNIEKRSLLKFSTSAELPRFMWPYALNEIAVLKNDTTSMVSVLARLNDDVLADYLADGLIVATPTGSTGYNLSVGGPIVQPISPSVVISPIAAHSLTMRPLVIDDSARLTLKVSARAQTFRVAIDGNSFSLPIGADICVEKAPFSIRIILRANSNFTETLRKKLLWGVRN